MTTYFHDQNKYYWVFHKTFGNITKVLKRLSQLQSVSDNIIYKLAEQFISDLGKFYSAGSVSY